jgi:hypothetical protein
MAHSQIFKTWLAFGLAANLALTASLGALPASPILLWLVFIPLSAYVLIALPESSAQLAAHIKRIWRHRHGGQAVRVKRMQA